MVQHYLLDTHALVFWQNKETISEEMITFLDNQNDQDALFVSDINFWEIAFLVKKGRLALSNPLAWSTELIQHSGIQLLSASYQEMIQSTLLPDLHKDPFDRLLISLTMANDLILVTKDEIIPRYEIDTFWM